MIISALLNLIYNVFSFLFFFELPQVPDSIMTIGQTVVDYMTQGLRIIESFIGSTAMGVLALLLQLVLMIHAAYLTYTLIRFILSKIPMLNIRM